MAQRKDVARFKRNSKVVNIIDLPDVPAGTPGRVYTVGGLSWIRYYVRFTLADGTNVDRSLVRDEWLETKADYDRQNNEAEREAYRAARKAEREAALAGAGTENAH